MCQLFGHAGGIFFFKTYDNKPTDSVNPTDSVSYV